MEQHAVFHVAEAEDLQVFVEPRRLLEVVNEQQLAHPVHAGEEEASNWIEYWNTRGVHQGCPNSGVDLRVDVVDPNLTTGVQILYLRLELLLCVDVVVALASFARLFLYGTRAVAVPAPLEKIA